MVAVPLLLVLAVIVHGDALDLRTSTTWSWALLGLLAVGWPIWRHLAPRPIQVLRIIAGFTTCAAVWLAYLCTIDQDWTPLDTLALRAYTIVAIALYAEIARALLDRRNRRSELVPEMRARARRSGASIDAPLSLPPL